MKLNILTGLLFIALTEYIPSGFSQDKLANSDRNQESYQNLPDVIVKKEVAFFTKMGAKDSSFATSSAQLIAFPIHNCSKFHVNFYHKKKNWLAHIKARPFDTTNHQLTFDTTSPSKLILIDNQPFWGTDGSIPKMEISYADYVHIKFGKSLPKNAFHGLYEPKFCTFISPKKKVKETKPTKNITAIFTKAFCSADGKRVYIYMLNGEGNARYEVTWILQNGEYYRRVIDKV